MKIKNIFLLTLFTLFISACSVDQIGKNLQINEKKALQREAVSNQLLGDINYILFLLKQKDLETLNSRFIHPVFGFFELSKDENLKKIILQQKFQIDEISDDIDSFDIKEEEAIFNCSPFDDKYYGWDKEGVFLVPSKSLYLSQLMQEENLIKIDRYSQKDIEKAVLMDASSYEITIPYNIILYLTKIDEQWYITLIDKIKTDCSANE